jgi:hypothetical protein
MTRGSPSLVNGVRLRTSSLRGSRVQIPPPAPFGETVNCEESRHSALNIDVGFWLVRPASGRVRAEAAAGRGSLRVAGQPRPEETQVRGPGVWGEADL